MIQYSSNFCRTLELPLIFCEVINLLCYIIFNAFSNQDTAFGKTTTNFMFQLLLYQLMIIQNYCNI